MQEVGFVRKITDEGKAVVHLNSPDPDCSGGCVGCAAQAAKDGRDIELDTIEGLQSGDYVKVDIPRRSPLWGTFMLFVIPMLLLVGGVMLGYMLWPVAGGAGEVNIRALIIGVGFMVGWYIVVALLEKYVLTPVPPPSIIAKVDDSELHSHHDSHVTAHQH